MKRKLTSDKIIKILIQLAGIALANVFLLTAGAGLPSLGLAGSQFLPFRIPIIFDLSDQSQPMVKPSKGQQFQRSVGPQAVY